MSVDSIVLSAAERRFAAQVVGRRRLFLTLSSIGVLAGVGLGIWYGTRWAGGDLDSVGAHAALVVLVLLNARQNLRQYRYAGLIERLQATLDGGRRDS